LKVTVRGGFGWRAGEATAASDVVRERRGVLSVVMAEAAAISAAAIVMEGLRYLS
jgi:hypothetical protein